MPFHRVPYFIYACLASLLFSTSTYALASDSKTTDGARKSLSSFQGKPSLEPNGPVRERPRSQKAIINPDYWIYSAGTSLYFDYDGDGHYTRLLVEFDLDTSFVVADVYARLYLSREGRPWLEYSATDTFSVYADYGDDSYVVETDLVEGYPFAYYDVLIEVYDAYTNHLLAEFGPADSAALSNLPLEDEARDQGFVEIVVGGGGSVTLSFFLMLALLCVARMLGQATEVKGSTQS